MSKLMSLLFASLTNEPVRMKPIAHAVAMAGAQRCLICLKDDTSWTREKVLSREYLEMNSSVLSTRMESPASKGADVDLSKLAR